MKTMTFIALLFCVTNIFAQSNLYTGTKVFNEGDYSYQCDVSPTGNVYLYNISNSWIGIDQKVKETNQIFSSEDAFIDLITDESWLQNKTEFKTIVRNAFSALDRNTWSKSGTLYVNFFVNADTGKVDDVRFYFDRDSSYVYLPVSFFRQLELALKENIQYVLMDAGKKLNFV